MTKNLAWEVFQSKVIYRDAWIEVLRDTIQVGEKTIKYAYTRRLDEGPNIIAEEPDGKLWLVQQYRHPTGKTVWQFPCEGKHEGETWEEAVHRGLREELGREAGSLIDLGMAYVDPGGSKQKTRHFLARKLTMVKREKTDKKEIEDLRIQAFSLEEIETLIQSEAIVDHWTFAGLYLYERYQRKQGKR